MFNVEVTGPYGHDGAYVNLKGIIKHHLNPAQAVELYDVTQVNSALKTQFLDLNTKKALSKLEENRKALIHAIQEIRLNNQQVNDLTSFLLTLTDSCVKSVTCLDPWMPNNDETDPDGLRLKARMLTSVAR